MTPQNAKLYVKDYIANKNEMAINKAHINAMKKIKEPDSAIGLNYYIHSGIGTHSHRGGPYCKKRTADAL
jgi:hypothetical protein